MTVDVSSEKAFTLIELIIAMALLAIVMTIAMPNVSLWMKNSAFSAVSRDLVSALRLGKSTAVSSNVNVVARFVSGAYTPAGGVGSYMVFIDDGSGGGTAGNSLRDGGERILAQQDMPKGVSLTSTNFGNVVTFNNRGFASSSGIVTLKNESRERTVNVTLAGAVSQQ
ncbi:MAG: GspH/FimT family pseudopilin [Desulfuromonadales bacterium]